MDISYAYGFMMYEYFIDSVQNNELLYTGL